MVESPAQSGRMRTLIHRGPIPRGHVMGTEAVSGIHDMCLMLLIGNLVSKRLKLEWIGHMVSFEVLVSIYKSWLPWFS